MSKHVAKKLEKQRKRKAREDARRILHSALQQNDAVTTHSEGEEPNRHVVITLKQQN